MVRSANVEAKLSWLLRAGNLLRRTWPWLLGLAILGIVASRVPLASFREALGQGPHLALAALNVGAVVLTLCTDAVATWTVLATAQMRRPLTQIVAVRGASFVLFVVNYALGQSAFGYYLHRTGAAPMRAVGATLYLVGTNLATLVLLTTLAWGLRGQDLHGGMWWSLVGISAAFGVYLLVIALRPAFLARWAVLTPLFDAGLRGHALAMLGRVPHLVVMAGTIWVAMRVWGIAVPLSTAAAVMPVVVIAGALPIAPAGVGTTQAALVYFFSAYATSAQVFAFSIVQLVYFVLANVALGLVCIPFAKRTGSFVKA